MIRKEIVFAIALGGCLGTAIAFAQDNAAGPAATGPTVPPAPADASVPASGDDVIHLHMPVHHRTVHAHASREAAPTAAPGPATVDSIGADATASPPAAAPVTAGGTETSSAAPPSPPVEAPRPVHAHAPAKKSAPAIPFSFGEDSGSAPPAGSAPPTEPQAAASTRDTKTASLPPKPEIPKQTTVPVRPTREAARAKVDEHAGLTKRGAVLFDKGKSNPSPQQFDGLKLLAGDVSTALESGASRVQLEAYGGAPGDKSSDARRLSLKRALAVRQLLIDDGIPSNRIDLRAMGGTDDKGPDDRVDVYVRAS